MKVTIISNQWWIVSKCIPLNFKELEVGQLHIQHYLKHILCVNSYTAL